MQRIHLPLLERSYDIHIGNGILAQSGPILQGLSAGSPLIVISSANILERHGAALVGALEQSQLEVKTLLVPEGEEHKHMATVERLASELASLHANRQSTLVAFGGGVVGDITGFAASIFFRGIDYVQIPTTFLAQIDSSIGGKTGVNLQEGKNLVGTFYQPRAVIIDPQLLMTLPPREFFSGLFEAVKYGIIQSRPLFDLIAGKHATLLGADIASLETVIAECARIKAEVVARDEREGRLRMILNFGHTLGHALEAATQYRHFTHGEGVGHGMIMASQLAVRLGKLASEAASEIERTIQALSPLPNCQFLSVDQILTPMFSDKKFGRKKIRFILPTEIGRVEILDDTPLDAVKGTVQTYLEQQRAASGN